MTFAVSPSAAIHSAPRSTASMGSAASSQRPRCRRERVLDAALVSSQRGQPRTLEVRARLGDPGMDADAFAGEQREGVQRRAHEPAGERPGHAVDQHLQGTAPGRGSRRRCVLGDPGMVHLQLHGQRIRRLPAARRRSPRRTASGPRASTTASIRSSAQAQHPRARSRDADGTAHAPRARRPAGRADRRADSRAVIARPYAASWAMSGPPRAAPARM